MYKLSYTKFGVIVIWKKFHQVLTNTWSKIQKNCEILLQFKLTVLYLNIF